MRRHIAAAGLIILTLASIACGPGAVASEAQKSGPLRFEITLSKSLRAAGASGRLFVMMAPARLDNTRGPLQIGFDPSATWLAAKEVTNLQPGQTITFDADKNAYPAGFSTENPGTYRFMALLDQDHSFAYDQQDAGDLFGPVVTTRGINPAHAAPVSLRLDRVTPERFAVVNTPDVQTVAFVSPMLSKFWRHPVTVHAVVILPPSHRKNPARTYGTAYIVTGFGGTYRDGYYNAPSILRKMASGKIGEMAHVFLDASFATGHTVFANSANNGPLGRYANSGVDPLFGGAFSAEGRSSGSVPDRAFVGRVEHTVASGELPGLFRGHVVIVARSGGFEKLYGRGRHARLDTERLLRFPRAPPELGA